MVIFKGKKAKIGPVKTMDITTSHLRAVFFPKNFSEKYKYLGAIPWDEEGEIFKAMEPLIIFMDYKAKPKYCPRWFLRFLHLFGNDNSIVRMRNLKLHNLHQSLTKGIFMSDYKTKWENYDLRISVSGDEQINNLSDGIESDFYIRGKRSDLIEGIKRIEPSFDREYLSLESLKVYYEKLEE